MDCLWVTPRLITGEIIKKLTKVNFIGVNFKSKRGLRPLSLCSRRVPRVSNIIPHVASDVLNVGMNGLLMGRKATVLRKNLRVINKTLGDGKIFGKCIVF